MQDSHPSVWQRRNFLASAVSTMSTLGLASPIWAASAAVAGQGSSGASLVPPSGPRPLERRVSHAGHSIYVQEYPGKSPAFVLLHGFPDNLHIYDGLAPRLAAAGRRVVTFDFLGFGASDKPAGFKYSFEQQLGDLEAVADALKLDKFIPVPHDASGPAAINYALDHPERIASLVLLNTYYHESTTTHFPELITLFSEPQLHELAMHQLTDPKRMTDLLQFQNKRFTLKQGETQRNLFDDVTQPLINANFGAGAGPAFVQLTSDLRHNVAYNDTRLNEFAKLKVPVFAFFGLLDPYLDRSVAEDFVRRFPNARFQGLDAGHWVQIDLPEELAALMLESA